MEFQWAFSCQVPSRNTAGNAFSCRKLRMALKRPETACPGTENVGDFDGRPGHGCRYRRMTRTLHQPITCAKAKTAATAAPAASFLSPIRTELHFRIGVLQFASIASAQRVYLGFDKNDYPGDSALGALRGFFQFTSYWLNNPPGFDHNPWAGKRSLIKQKGFGFLVLFNGRIHNEMQAKDAAALGKAFHETSASFWTKKKVDDCYLIRQRISLRGSMQYAEGERERAFIAQQLTWLKETAKSIRRKTSCN